MTRLSTGIEGLDEVLQGGLLAGRVYMVRGIPGAGKTTLGMQFLIEGARRGERSLFVTLSESAGELRDNAASHGWDLDGVEILDLHPAAEGIEGQGQYSIFHPADVELIPVASQIREALDKHRPDRVVFDSLTQVRLLSRDPLRYRRQVVALKEVLIERQITSIFLGESSSPAHDAEIESIVQGIVVLFLRKGNEGMTRRSVEIQKLRGSSYREGEHPFRIDRGGLRVFPRLLATEHGRDFRRDPISTGIAGLDEMLGGGLEKGTCTLVTGNAGVGKTTLGMAVIARAAADGKRCALYTFDEGPSEIVSRGESIGLELQTHIDAGRLAVRKVNPLLLYPDEFASWVRVEVERRDAQVIMIDSLNGYNQSMPDEHYLGGHMHQLIGYLNQMGVSTLLVNEVTELIGTFAATQFGISYMADNVIVIRYYEYNGSICKAIGTIKKRLSSHEKWLRSFEVTGEGLIIGAKLPMLRGILRGEATRVDAPGGAEVDHDG